MCSTTTQSLVVFLHVREPDMATRKGLFVASPDDRPTRAAAVDNARWTPGNGDLIRFGTANMTVATFPVRHIAFPGKMPRPWCTIRQG